MGRQKRSAELIAWEWSVLLVVMLILSPHTAFEYITLALGAVSYAIVRVSTTTLPPRERWTRWLSLGAALFLLGVLLPRSVQNKLALVDLINRWTGYTHFTLSEAYQYYCFPLLGLGVLALTIWRLEPARPK